MHALRPLQVQLVRSSLEHIDQGKTTQYSFRRVGQAEQSAPRDSADPSAPSCPTAHTLLDPEEFDTHLLDHLHSDAGMEVQVRQLQV